MSYQRVPDPKPVAKLISCVSLRAIQLMGKPYKPYAGSVLVPCPHCGDQMWLGPKSRAVHEAEGAPVACCICIVKFGGDLTKAQSLGNKHPGE